TLVEPARHQNTDIYSVFSARNTDVVLGKDIIKKARGNALYVDDADGSSDVRNVEPWISEIIESGRVQQAYVCGSNRLIELTTRLAAPADVETYVSLEAHMACGLGYCHSCATGAFGESAESPLVCRDGPVFRCHPAGVTV
ncbi:MAG: dihydroorotate oxidase electron transfer subunit, partial [Dehalococcoidia bacterium]|nr:dihydroorotate oxidase electron transfer subunit [Dehalococcoidia bacterium]